jgi:hypothetical protein
MKFEEIFKEKGWYVCDGFIQGYCYVVDEDGWLYSLNHKNVNDLFPIKEPALLNKSILKRDFKKVFTRQALFKQNTNKTNDFI